MNLKRLAVLLLAAIFVIGAVLPMTAIDAKGMVLSTRQEYFLEMILSYARADRYENHICGALTASQAIIESGWGTTGLGKIGLNLFGIRAYETWGGLVYDMYSSRDGVVYSSFDDLVIAVGDYRNISPWRAYADWSESIADHSNLLNTRSYYEPLRGVYDYKEACRLILECGYTSESHYATALIDCIELYELTRADDVSANEFGIITPRMSNAQKKCRPGDEFDLSFEVVADGDTTYKASDIVWSSDNEAVATVDQNGHVKVYGENGDVGLIRLSIGSRSTCCIIDVVDMDGFDGVTTTKLNMRKGPGETYERIGQVAQGIGVVIHSASDGWSYCTAKLTSGSVATGWLSSDYIIPNVDENQVRVFGLAKYYHSVRPGEQIDLRYAIGNYNASHNVITWRSSDENVLTVDQNGRVTGVNKGMAIVTATTESGIVSGCTICVQDGVQFYTGLLTCDLNLRHEPSTSARTYGQVAEGSECTVIGECENGWYRVTATTKGGVTATGWCLSVYIIIKGFASQYPLPYEMENDGFVTDENYFYGVLPGTSASEITSLSSGNSIKITKNGSALADSDTVSTGCIISQKVDGKTVEREVVIIGDVVGDGSIDALDHYAIKLHLTTGFELTAAQKKAADINFNGSIDASDYILAARYFMGYTNIVQRPLA